MSDDLLYIDSESVTLAQEVKKIKILPGSIEADRKRKEKQRNKQETGPLKQMCCQRGAIFLQTQKYGKFLHYVHKILH